MSERISADYTYPSKYIDIDGSKIHYVEVGSGTPILLLHGVPTSSYLWRNVIPYLSSLGRCIAPDLIGFGRSDKPDIDYSIKNHIHYIEQFIERLQLHKLIIVMHGVGSIIGFDYAMRHEKNCRGLVFYEAFLRSLNSADTSLPFQEQLLALQNEEHALDMVSDGTFYVDKLIPQGVMRAMTEAEMQRYREPFQQSGSAKPIQHYLREFSARGQDVALQKLIANYTDKLTHSHLPKLMLYSIPGFITTIATVIWAKEHLPQLEIIDIGEELHLGQESNPKLIADAVSVWIQGIEQSGR